MTTLTKNFCKNCFAPQVELSNFCSQECFDEWIMEQHNRIIKAFYETLADKTPFHLMEAEIDRRLK